MTTAEQRLSALVQANRTKARHCEIRAEVKAGDLTVAEVLYLHSEEVETMAIGKLLRAKPWWGKDKSARLLGLLRISDTRKIGELTNRQAAMVADLSEGT